MAGGAASRQILVADDDPLVREAITLVLCHAGYALDSVETATNGREALSRVAERRTAVVLVDDQMPILDGAGFLRAMRAHGFGVPVLLLTGDPCPDQLAAHLGADGYVAKPFRPANLLAAVERFYP